MGEPLLAIAPRAIERGDVTFLYRPRVEQYHPEDLGDVQRVLLLLSPEGAVHERLIAVGRKRLPPSKLHPRFWGYVDLVLAPYDMNNALDTQVYGTKTRGLRHLPAARALARGAYDIATHGDHTHLRWEIDSIDENDPVANDLAIEPDADYIVTVMNPDPAVWGLSEPPDLQASLFDELEQHVTIPTPFPPRLQTRFRNRKYAQLDSTAWLDHPGAELVFVGVTRSAA